MRMAARRGMGNDQQDGRRESDLQRQRARQGPNRLQPGRAGQVARDGRATVMRASTVASPAWFSL